MSGNTFGQKPVIGIVGGIGAGKSTVAGEFVALGCVLIDADRIGHELLGEPDLRAEIVQRWGDRVIGSDGEISRRALGEIVFAVPAELEALNAILHPRMRRRMEERIEAMRKDEVSTGAVLDAAVLFEAGWDDLCTARVFVSAPAADRFSRVSRSRGWDREDWSSREKSQISLDIKASKCDYTIDNRFDVPSLREQVHVIFHRIRPKD